MLVPVMLVRFFALPQPALDDLGGATLVDRLMIGIATDDPTRGQEAVRRATAADVADYPEAYAAYRGSLPADQQPLMPRKPAPARADARTAATASATGVRFFNASYVPDQGEFGGPAERLMIGVATNDPDPGQAHEAVRLATAGDLADHPPEYAEYVAAAGAAALLPVPFMPLIEEPEQK